MFSECKLKYRQTGEVLSSSLASRKFWHVDRTRENLKTVFGVLLASSCFQVYWWRVDTQVNSDEILDRTLFVSNEELVQWTTQSTVVQVASKGGLNLDWYQETWRQMTQFPRNQEFISIECSIHLQGHTLIWDLCKTPSTFFKKTASAINFDIPSIRNKVCRINYRHFDAYRMNQRFCCFPCRRSLSLGLRLCGERKQTNFRRLSLKEDAHEQNINCGLSCLEQY